MSIATMLSSRQLMSFWQTCRTLVPFLCFPNPFNAFFNLVQCFSMRKCFGPKLSISYSAEQAFNWVERGPLSVWFSPFSGWWTSFFTPPTSPTPWSPSAACWVYSLRTRLRHQQDLGLASPGGILCARRCWSEDRSASASPQWPEHCEQTLLPGWFYRVLGVPPDLRSHENTSSYRAAGGADADECEVMAEAMGERSKVVAKWQWQEGAQRANPQATRLKTLKESLKSLKKRSKKTLKRLRTKDGEQVPGMSGRQRGAEAGTMNEESVSPQKSDGLPWLRGIRVRNLGTFHIISS